jgi:hypothetical protein
MGLFSKKEKKQEANMEGMPVTVTFSDKSSILATNPRDAGMVITHSDGSICRLMMFDVSNYAKEGETVYITKHDKVVVEKAINSDGSCDNLTKEEMYNYAIQYVYQLARGNFDPSQICRYIGRLDPKTGQMIVSEKVRDSYVNAQLEPIMKKELSDEIARKNREYQERAAKEMEAQMAQAAIEHREFVAREDSIRVMRKAAGRFELVRGSANGKDDNYDGVDLDSGDVLRVRNLCKVGKDEATNIYLYTANVSTTPNEHDVEILTASEKVIAFATKVKIDELAKTPEGRRKALEIFTKGNREAEYGGGMKFIGNFDERAELISEDLESCPQSIQRVVESMSEKVAQNQNRINESFKKANQRSEEDREI